MAYASYKWSKEPKRDEWRNVALNLIGLGVRLMPLGGNLRKGEEKKPLYRFLPRNPDNENKASWKMLASQGPTTPQMIDAWLAGGACGFAALTGHLYSNSLYIFDFDVDGYFEKWIANTKVNAILRDSKAFVQKTGGGGFQVFLFLEGKTPANKQYAWHPCDNEQGRVIAIESRGRGGYAVGPCSAHPSGNEYKPLDMFGGTLKEMTRITSDDFKILEDVAMSLCKVPKSKKQIEREKRNQERERERATRAASKPRYASSDHGDVIGRFNHDNDIETILLSHGYTRGVGGRLSRPDAPKNSGSGVVLYHGDNKSFHYSSNDDLSDGHAKTPFDVILHFEFDGDMTRAIKEIASNYGIDHASTRQASRRSKDYFDVRHALPSIVTSDVPSWLANAPLAHELAPTPSTQQPRANTHEPTPTHSTYAQQPRANTHEPTPTHSTYAQQPRANTHEFDYGYDDGNELNCGLGSWPNSVTSATFTPPPPPPPPPTEDYPIDDYQTIDYDQLLIDCAVMAPAQLSADHDQPMPERKKYSWPTFKPNQIIELNDGQYVSDVFDFDSVKMGQVWGVQSGTGTGKTTAANELDNFVMAVPLVGQVKQFVTRFGGSGLYEGQPLALNSRKHFSTYDSLVKLIKAHEKGEINLKERTAIIDEAHHIALDGFKDTNVFDQLLEFVSLCGRAIFMTGTMPPLNSITFDHTIEIAREKPAKPLKSVLTKDLANFIMLTKAEHEIDGQKVLLDIHLNNKKSIAGYQDEVLGLDFGLNILAFSKETEENEEPHHMRLLNDDRKIDSDVDIMFRTSIIDDGIDILADRKVVSIVVSNVTPLTIEQAGARFRNNLPIMTYVVRLSDNRKKEEKENDYFYMQREYDQRVRKAESRISHLNALLDIESMGDKLKDRASTAQSVMWGKLLDEYIIKDNEIKVNTIKILQDVTKKWGYFCKRNDDALNDALSPYGYRFDNFEKAANGANLKAREEQRKAVKDAKKEIENRKIKDAVKSFDSITDVEIITTRYGNKKQKTEVHKAASLVTTLYDTGLTFEASKEIIEGLSGFHGRTVGNTEKAIRASRFYHSLKADNVEQTSSGKALERLFFWLEERQKNDEAFSSEQWAEEVFKACVWAMDDLARENFFDTSASPKALKDRRGQLLSSMARLEQIQTRENGKKKTLSLVSGLPRFSDSQFQNGLTGGGLFENGISKTPIISKKRAVLLIPNATNCTAETHNQAEMILGPSEENDNVRNDYGENEPDNIILAKISRLLDAEKYAEALTIADDIQDFTAKKRSMRYIAARKKDRSKK